MEGRSNLSVIKQAGATINARRQTIRAEEDSSGARVENYGTLRSTDGRALQLRSFGATILNYGDLIGGEEEEVVEGRGGFYLENHGNIFLNDPGITDEDGVQFAGGEVLNLGRITGSDDGIDVDEGRIVNAAGAVIRSTAPDANANSGIYIDPVYEDGVNPPLTSGTLIKGFFDGRLGLNTVMFDGIALRDLTSFAVSGDTVDLLFLSSGDRLSGQFRNFGVWVLEGRSYSAAELADEIALAPVPVPAGLPLLLSALGGITLLRRH